MQALDWATVASLATAAGTLVLAAATFASVRASGRAARIAEESLLTSVRPLLMPSHLQDVSQKVGFADGHWVQLPGGAAVAERGEHAIYLAISLRNAGNGIAVLDGWRLEEQTEPGAAGRPRLEDFRRLTRDLYVPAGETGFWQGAIRDEDDPQWSSACERIERGEPIVVDLLYGDHHGGQRVVSRFRVVGRRHEDGEEGQTPHGRLVIVARHWNVDRPDPR